MRFGEPLVQLESLFGCGAGARVDLLGRALAALALQQVGIRQPRVGGGVAGVFLDRLIKVTDGLFEAVFRALVPEVAPPQIGVISFRVDSPAGSKLRLLPRSERGLDLAGNRLRHVALQSEHIRSRRADSCLPRGGGRCPPG